MDSTITDKAAEGMGFIEDQTGRLETVGVSVFHQLHCLVSISFSFGEQFT